MLDFLIAIVIRGMISSPLISRNLGLYSSTWLLKYCVMLTVHYVSTVVSFMTFLRFWKGLHMFIDASFERINEFL